MTLFLKPLFFNTLLLTLLLAASYEHQTYAQSMTGRADTIKYTLSRAIETGLKASNELKISQSRLKASEARLTEQTSYMLPQLRFLAGYTRLSDIPPFEVTLPIPNLPVRSIRLSDVILNNYNLRLSFQQPLFTGFRLSSLRSSASENLSATEAEYSRDVNETAFKIHSAFWMLYRAEEMIKYINESLKQSQVHLNDTRQFLENGLITKNDLLKLEVQYSNIRLQQIEAQNSLEIARAAFNQALGLPISEITGILTDSISVSDYRASYEQLLGEAREGRNELKALAWRTQAGRSAVKAARSGWYPQISLGGNLYYNRPNQRIQPARDKFYDTWDIGVTLSWDIWNWGQTSSQAAQAEQTLLQSETALKQMNEAIEIEVYQNFLTLKRSEERIEVSRMALEQARENLRIINQKYQEQLATSTDIIDAEASVLQASTGYSTALVDYQIARVRLEKSAGRKIY